MAGNIVFRSERDGGGLFVVSALGGAERRLASFGVQPKWSPDGSRNSLCVGTQVRVVLSVCHWAGRPAAAATCCSDLPQARHGLLDGVASGRTGVSLIGNFHRADEAGSITVARDGAIASTTTSLAPTSRWARRDEVHRARVVSGIRQATALYIEITVNDVYESLAVRIDASTLEVGSAERLTTGAGQDTGMAVSRDGTRARVHDSSAERDPALGLTVLTRTAATLAPPSQPLTPDDGARDG